LIVVSNTLSERSELHSALISTIALITSSLI